MADKWIKDAIKRPGAFTKKAEKRKLSVKEFASRVTANPDKYDTRTVRQANLAKTLSKLRKRKKK
tara:strand:- start:643 stop:837 length:195 start_codon:yes stop_codon:yes gene_type:complete